MAVQVIGKNLGSGISKPIMIQVARGGMDFIRACHAESEAPEIGMLPVLDYPVQKFMVGYAPQSVQGQKDSVPAFVQHSSSHAACVGEAEVDSPNEDLACWKYFARDRSLAAPDWKLIIPLMVGGGATESNWVMGDGLSSDVKPVIEDIIVYFRYVSRPIDESM